MSEHEWNVGDWALLRVEVREAAGGLGMKVEVPDAGGRSGVYVNPADLIPDDRHRTPIAPEDVREGDVVRLEWEDDDGRPRAHEGPVHTLSGPLYVEGYRIDNPSRTLYLLSRAPTERDKWWPPQPGDTISDGVGRVTRGKSDEWRLNPDHPDFYRRQTQVLWTDADVPDDAVLVLPAQTREATS